MSTFARDIASAVSEGSRAWFLLTARGGTEFPDPLAATYRNRLQSSIELALAASSLTDIDKLPEAVDVVLATEERIVVRLPSDPLVAFDGSGAFSMGSGFRRELDALDDLAVRHARVDLELCVVAQSEPDRAHPDPDGWNRARLDYLDEAIGEAGHRSRLAACTQAELPFQTRALDEGDPCAGYLEPLTRQALLIIRAD